MNLLLPFCFLDNKYQLAPLPVEVLLKIFLCIGVLIIPSKILSFHYKIVQPKFIDQKLQSECRESKIISRKTIFVAFTEVKFLQFQSLNLLGFFQCLRNHFKRKKINLSIQFLESGQKNFIQLYGTIQIQRFSEQEDYVEKIHSIYQMILFTSNIFTAIVQRLGFV